MCQCQDCTVLVNCRTVDNYFVGVEDSIGGPTISLGFLFLETGLNDHVNCKKH